VSEILDAGKISIALPFPHYVPTISSYFALFASERLKQLPVPATSLRGLWKRWLPRPNTPGKIARLTGISFTQKICGDRKHISPGRSDRSGRCCRTCVAETPGKTYPTPLHSQVSAAKGDVEVPGSIRFAENITPERLSSFLEWSQGLEENFSSGTEGAYRSISTSMICRMYWRTWTRRKRDLARV